MLLHNLFTVVNSRASPRLLSGWTLSLFLVVTPMEVRGEDWDALVARFNWSFALFKLFKFSVVWVAVLNGGG